MLLRYACMSFIILMMSVTSCGKTKDTSTDSVAINMDSLFSEVKDSEECPEESSNDNVKEFANYRIQIYYEEETKQKRFFAYPNFTLGFKFFPETESGMKTKVFSYRYDSDDYGAGYVDNGRLVVRRAEDMYEDTVLDQGDEVFTFGSQKYCVRKNAPIIFDVDMDKLDQFVVKDKSDWDPQRTTYAIYTEMDQYVKSDQATPETIYKSNDGMTIKIKLYKVPVNIEGVKAIVYGEIENPTKAFASCYEEECCPYIYSVLTDDDCFYSEFYGEGEGGSGPLVSWSEDALRIMVDPDNRSSDIIMKAIR